MFPEAPRMKNGVQHEGFEQGFAEVRGRVSKWSGRVSGMGGGEVGIVPEGSWRRVE
jgi:hypothetical protein